MLDLVTSAEVKSERRLRYRSTGFVILTIVVTLYQLPSVPHRPLGFVAAALIGAGISAAITFRWKWPVQSFVALLVLSTGAALFDAFVVGIWGWILAAFVAACWIQADRWQWIFVAVSVIVPSIVIQASGAGAAAAIGVATAMVAASAIGFALRDRALLAITVAERELLAQQAAELETRSMLAEERTRIARDLHDALSQSLAIISAQADGAGRVLDSDPGAAAQALAVISRTSREAQAQVRTTVFELRDSPPLTAQTLGPAIEDLIAKVGYSGLTVSTTIDGPFSSISGRTAECVYLISREALTNVLKYASPSAEARFALAATNESVTVTVTNAVAPGVEDAGIGNGITGMRERTEALGGALTITRTPEKFTLIATIPTEAE